MFDIHEVNDSTIGSTLGFSETDIPDPIDHWSLDDFEDLLPDTLK